MKIRALLLALGMATVLTGCQNMDSNGLLSSGAEAFQAYTLSDAQVKALSDQSCQDSTAKRKSRRRAANTLNDWQKLPPRWGITLTASR